MKTFISNHRSSFLAFASLSIVTILAGVIYAGVAQRQQRQRELSENEARRMIARVGGSELSTNAVRIKEIQSQLGSAIVVAEIETAFRFAREADGAGWRVAEIRLGDNRWQDVDMLVRALDRERAERARAELETTATALEMFRRERGFYFPSNDYVALIDHLSPRYLARVIRIDPWRRPYSYEGTRDQYRIRSLGADGEANTPDDIIIDN
jgi:hypothetical protein